MKFFLPSWNGDFRLEPHAIDVNASVLTMVNPTPQELVVVGAFLTEAKKKKWWDGAPPKKGQPYAGPTSPITVNGPLAKTSKVMVRVARPADRTLTAVKFASGKMEVVEGAGVEALKAVEGAVSAAQADEAKGGGGGAAAVSVKRPTPCCPQCLPGAIEPATEVLLSFLTDEQHRQWERERAIVVEGGLSGHRYVIAHRHSPIAQRVGKICFDTDDGEVLHFHDWSVPPEEEVLAAKLIMEHAEPWLRNEATIFGDGLLRYKNPFGDVQDGVETSSFFTGVGGVLMAAAGLRHDGRPAKV